MINLENILAEEKIKQIVQRTASKKYQVR